MTDFGIVVSSPLRRTCTVLDDVIVLFVQEEDAEAERVKEERLKAYQEKKSKSKPSVMFILHLKNNWYVNT